MNFTVPLTCKTHLTETPEDNAILLFEVVAITSINVVAWFVIVVSNLAIITMVLKQLMKPINKENPKRRQRLSDNLRRCSIMVVSIAAVFTATSFPFVWISLNGYYFRHTDSGIITFYRYGPKVTFYMTWVTFLSVPLHPWLYLLRLRSVKVMVSKSVTSFQNSVNPN